MAKSNGFKPGSLDWIEQQYEFHRSKADMYRGVLEDMGGARQERKEQSANAMFRAALKAESARRRDVNARRRLNVSFPSPEDSAARRAKIEAFLELHPGSSIREILRGIGLHEDRIHVISKLLNERMPNVVRVGERSHSRYRLRSAAPLTGNKTPGPHARAKARAESQKKNQPRNPEHRQSTSFSGTTAEKARVIASILQRRGGIMSTQELAAAAKTEGVTSLVGIANYLRAGWLRRTRVPSGESAYRLLKLPPGMPAPAQEQAAE